MLVWAAPFGMDEPSRLLLGHHSTKKKPLACYRRGLLAKPLRELGEMLKVTLLASKGWF